MKRIISVFFIVLYCAVAVVFNVYGLAIRTVLSPHVTAVELISRTFIEVPNEAIHTDETGESYVYFAFESDRYPEKAYEAERTQCWLYEAGEETSLIALKSYSTNGKLLIISSDRDIIAGRRVIIAD